MTMDRRKSEDVAETLEELKEMLKKDKMVVFTSEQARILVELAEFWKGIKSVISLGSALGGGLKWLLVFFATWAALKSGLIEWLKAVVHVKP